VSDWKTRLDEKMAGENKRREASEQRQHEDANNQAVMERFVMYYFSNITPHAAKSVEIYMRNNKRSVRVTDRESPGEAAYDFRFEDASHAPIVISVIGRYGPFSYSGSVASYSNGISQNTRTIYLDHDRSGPHKMTEAEELYNIVMEMYADIAAPLIQ
jgi:hypothetical protein